MNRKSALTAILVLCFQFVVAQTFETRQLEYLNSLMPCLLPTTTAIFNCPQVCNIPLKVEYDTTGRVSHLGLSLFSDSLKMHKLSKPLYDFQERLFLEVFLQGNEMKARKVLKENNIQWLDLSRTLGAGSFFNSLERSLRLSQMDSVEYVMTKDSLTWISEWRGETGNFMLRFPANYDLISGMDKKEIGAIFAQQLQSFQCVEVPTPFFQGYLGDLEQINRSNYVMRGKELFIKAMNSNVYFGILYDRNYPEESIANLFNAPDSQRSKGLDLQIRQIAYGGDSLTYTLKLYDFQCCMSEDYEVFTGIEKCNEKVAEFSVIYRSKWYNCYHLLYVQTTPKILFERTGALKATFYTFIPNQNIKNLYKKYVEKK